MQNLLKEKTKTNDNININSDICLEESKMLYDRSIRFTSDIDRESSSKLIDYINNVNKYVKLNKRKLELENSIYNEQYEKYSEKKQKNDILAKIISNNKTLESYNSPLNNPIKIFLTTSGGSVPDGFRIIDAIRNSDIPVHIYATGYISSMGIPILLSGHKRFGSKYCRYLIHDVSGLFIGKLEEVRKKTSRCNEIRDMLDSIYFEKSKITKEFLNNIYENFDDYTFFSNEALDLGIIDAIY